MDQFSDLLSTYYQNPNASSFKVIQEHLWDAFIASISGIRKLRCAISQQSFLFIYPDGCHKSKVATIILWNNIEKDFSELIKFGFEELSNKAREKKLNAMLAGTDRIRWFRATAAIVLTNKVYGKEINLFKGAKNKANRTLCQDLSDSNGTVTSPIELVRTNALYGSEAAQLAFGVMSNSDDCKIEEKIKKAASAIASFQPHGCDHIHDEPNYNFNPDEDKYNKLSDEQSFSVYCDEIQNNPVEVIKSIIDRQSYSLFGKGTEPLAFVQPGDKKTVCIGFFYSWLRKCSGASYTEISSESQVSVSTVSRDWKPEAEMLKYFQDGCFHADYGIYPVFLGPMMRGHIGLYEKAIRNNKTYPADNASNLVFVSKRLLWDIYQFIMAQGQFDCFGLQIQGVGAPIKQIQVLKDKFDYQIISNRELGIHEDKRYLLAFIKDLKNVE
jgi:hypothetical protein